MGYIGGQIAVGLPDLEKPSPAEKASGPLGRT